MCGAGLDYKRCANVVQKVTIIKEIAREVMEEFNRVKPGEGKK